MDFRKKRTTFFNWGLKVLSIILLLTFIFGVAVKKKKAYIFQQVALPIENKAPVLSNRSLLLEKDVTEINVSTHMKSEKWYTKAFERLPFQQITPSEILLSQPYFKPTGEKRYPIKDKGIIGKLKCKKETELVILILSMPRDLNLRQVIRQTWGSVETRGSWPNVDFEMHVKLVFIVGVSRYIESEMKGIGKTGKLSRDDPFGLGVEAGLFGDLIQVSTIDSYANLTRKVITGLRIITENCPQAKHILKADQDIFVNVPFIWQFLKHNGRKNVIYGHIYFTGNVHRGGRWRVPESAYPMKSFPAYASGTSYIISMDAASKILDTYPLFPYIPIEDAFLTGIIGAVANIDKIFVSGFTHWSKESPHFCELVNDKIFTANRMTEEMLRNTWTEIVEDGRGSC